METHADGSRQNESLVDLAWRRLRSTADRLIERYAEEGLFDPRDRGEIYLFIVDLIARWVDRVEEKIEAANEEAVEKLMRLGTNAIHDRVKGYPLRIPVAS